ATAASRALTASRARAWAAWKASTARVGWASPTWPRPIRAGVAALSRAQGSGCSGSGSGRTGGRSAIGATRKGEEALRRQGVLIERAQAPVGAGKARPREPCLEFRRRAQAQGRAQVEDIVEGERLVVEHHVV